MAPKTKITKEMVLDTVLEITRETGFESVNARSIAEKLQCSTRPIFTCYKNMDELKKEFLDFSYEFYEQYVIDYSHSADATPCLLFPLSYIAFAQEEANLFKLLFINEMDLDMAEAKDFYKEIGNEKKAEIFADAIGVDLEKAKGIFLDLFLYAHGIAVLTVTKKISFDRSSSEKMITHLLSALIRKENPDWKISPG